VPGVAPPAFVDFERMFGALADHTRRGIVRRAISAEEGIVELASDYSMTFARSVMVSTVDS
jgi:hypothetical protein